MWLKFIPKATAVSWKIISNLGEKHNLDHWRKRLFRCMTVLHHTLLPIKRSGWRHEQFSEAKLWKGPPLTKFKLYWTILLIFKSRIYVDGRHITTNDTLWESLQDTSRSFSPYQIAKYTNSINKMLFEVIPNHENYMNYQKFFSDSWNLFIVRRYILFGSSFIILWFNL